MHLNHQFIKMYGIMDVTNYDYSYVDCIGNSLKAPFVHLTEEATHSLLCGGICDLASALADVATIVAGVALIALSINFLPAFGLLAFAGSVGSHIFGRGCYYICSYPFQQACEGFALGVNLIGYGIRNLFTPIYIETGPFLITLALRTIGALGGFLAFSIPSFLLYGVGTIVQRFSWTKINYRALSMRPDPLNFDQNKDEFINLDISGLKRFSTDRSFMAAIDQIKNRECNYENEHYDQIILHLKYILYRCQTSTKARLSDEERTMHLENLAKHFVKCQPTWIEGTRRTVEQIYYSGNETTENKLLRYVLQYKEAQMLLVAQQKFGSQWHSLNSARLILGKEFGFDPALARSDRYASSYNCFLINWIARLIFDYYCCSSNSLIDGVHTILVMRGSDPKIAETLQNLVEGKVGDEFDDEDDMEPFYKGDSLDRRAVNLLLRDVGILA